MIIRAYPKVNICLKITGFVGHYCEIASRFALVSSANLYDEMEIRANNGFKISGNFPCTMQENTIFRAKEALSVFLEPNKARMLENFSIEVDKKIPTLAGLGGGSSNAANYLLAMNEILELKLTRKDLMQVGAKVGADVSFFVCEYSSANVRGIGESVESFNEKMLDLEIFTPNIECSTKAVYDEFRTRIARGEARFFSDAKALLSNDSSVLLQKNTRKFLNDLYAPACKIYPQLAEFAKDGYFFSGSGSSFFRLKAE